MEGIQEPVAAGTAAVLRRAVLDHVRTERRRRFAPLLHAGVPGGAEEVFAAAPGDGLDHALRTDVVAPQERRHDVDVAWLAAARAAGAEAGGDVTLVVVTRRGWTDPRSGVRREWKRLRQR